MKPLKIVYKGGQGELVEKKSRFIATVRPVDSEEQALELIASMKKKYWDARHNCFAYVIGENHEIQRCSDDGEPQGTAGRPILEVLLRAQIHNAAIVVTRYFGGVLLGTGGLTRAYSGAAQAGLRESIVIEKRAGVLLRICTDYSGIGRILYLLGQRGLAVTHSEYTDIVMTETLVPREEVQEVREAVTEATGGKAEFPVQEDVYFAFADGEPLIFDE